jgi:hypothetical protein
MRLSHILKPRQIEDLKRSICFESFSSAKKFSKELLSDSYEISSILIEVKMSQGVAQGQGDRPNFRVIGDDIVYVNFNYNANHERDRNLLSRLLKEYDSYIIH